MDYLNRNKEIKMEKEQQEILIALYELHDAIDSLHARLVDSILQPEKKGTINFATKEIRNIISTEKTRYIVSKDELTNKGAVEFATEKVRDIISRLKI